MGIVRQNPVFTHNRLRGLAREIAKIALEFVSLDLTQTNNLVGMLGLSTCRPALQTEDAASASDTDA
ncbi:MAG TPA: hypothetical protein VET25_11465, partial [Aestuariivirgaceae bacterium]|nr:hypothetical protein [Aestuariivirgaceae bacterium]